MTICPQQCQERRSRSSPEERGLKFPHPNPKPVRNESLLTRGAWIEISAAYRQHEVGCRRSSPEERGLK